MRVILLVQTNTRADLARQRSMLEGLLRLPGVAGFSLRVPARELNPAPKDWSGLAIFDDAMDMAEAVGGCEVQFRTMYGRWAPRHASRRWGTFPGGSLGGTDVGLPPFDYPLTFGLLGQRQRRFWNWMMRAQSAVIQKSWEARERGLPCEVVHMSHPAGTWAEVFVIPDMTRYVGYKLETVVQTHVDVMKAAAAKWDGQVEFALSGHVYPGDIRGYVYGTLGATARDAGGAIIINRNDIRNETNFAGMPTAYPLGWQSYAAGSTYRASNGQIVQYDWPLVFDQAERCMVVYYEAYPGNFDQTFRAEIARRYG